MRKSVQNQPYPASPCRCHRWRRTVPARSLRAGCCKLLRRRSSSISRQISPSRCSLTAKACDNVITFLFLAHALMSVQGLGDGDGDGDKNLYTNIISRRCWLTECISFLLFDEYLQISGKNEESRRQKRGVGREGECQFEQSRIKRIFLVWERDIGKCSECKDIYSTLGGKSYLPNREICPSKKIRP